MTVDYTVSCDSSEYRFGFIWACVMVLVYPIGCPAYYFYLLYGVRHEIQCRNRNGEGDVSFSGSTNRSTNDNASLNGEDRENGEDLELSEESRLKQEKLLSLRFLYESYHPHYWWWEIAETTQRLLLTGILVLIAQGSAIQIVVGALLTLTFLQLYARYEPFTDDFVLSIKIVSFWQIFFVFWIALLIKADFPSMSFHSLGVCLVIVIFANIFIDVWKVCWTAFYTSRRIRSISTSNLNHNPNFIQSFSSPFRMGNNNEDGGETLKDRDFDHNSTSNLSSTEMGHLSTRFPSSDTLTSSSPIHNNLATSK